MILYRTLLPLLMAVALISCKAVAQVEAPSGNSGTINYTVGDLEKMDKLQLTTIYGAKLTRLHVILPYLPFGKLEPKGPGDLKIPDIKHNQQSMEGLRSEQGKYNTQLTESMAGIGPYADKNQLIYSILFLQSIINKIELIGLGMTDVGFDK
jgi:hypothetical protein